MCNICEINHSVILAMVTNLSLMFMQYALTVPEQSR